jgi:hypothetical protein
MRLALILMVTACSAPRPAINTSASDPVSPTASGSATAPDAQASDGQAESDMIEPCVPGSAEHVRASEELAALGTRIETLAIDGDPKPLDEALAQLLETPCFALTKPPRGGLESDSARALKAFWDDGAAWWIEHLLTIGEYQRAITAPTLRTTLRASHPLACPTTEKQCESSTRAWRQRAETALARMAAGRRLAAVTDTEDPYPTEATCAAEAKRAAPNIRFDQWLDCIQKLPVSRMALPIGDTRPPETGWLLVRGRRGHYNFCDEVRAYEVATGSAIIAKSCSGLELAADGSVDGAGTNAKRALVVEQGEIPVAILREAAWMIILSPEAQSDVVAAETYDLPPGVKPQRGSIGIGSMGFGGGTFSSNQTQLSWSYMVDGSAVASGTLTWPIDYDDDARQYSVELLTIAEASLVTGCATARPPRHLDFGLDEPGVSSLDADAETLTQTEQTLLEAIAKLKLRRCAAERKRPRRRN